MGFSPQSKIPGYVVYTTQNSSDNFASYPPDNHHCSDDVYRMGGEIYSVEKQQNK